MAHWQRRSTGMLIARRSEIRKLGCPNTVVTHKTSGTRNVLSTIWAGKGMMMALMDEVDERLMKAGGRQSR